MRTVHGLTVSGFPNWFYLGLGQSAVAANYTTNLDDQTKHVAYILSTVATRGAIVVEPTAEAESDWIAQTRLANTRPAELYADCTPGYYNNEGRGGVTICDESYAPGVNAFNALLHDCGSGLDEWHGFELKPLRSRSRDALEVE